MLCSWLAAWKMIEPGPTRFNCPFDKRLHRAFLDDEQFLVRMLVRRVRRLALVQRRDVDFEFVECRGRRLDDLADLPVLFGSAVIAFQSKTVDPITGALARNPVAPASVMDEATSATKRSLRLTISAP